MVDVPGRYQSLHGSPDRVCHIGFKRAHNDASSGWGCVLPLGIKPETTPQLVDFPTYPRTFLDRRYQNLDTEVTQVDKQIRGLCARANPALLAAYGIGPDTAAALSGRSR